MTAHDEPARGSARAEQRKWSIERKSEMVAADIWRMGSRTVRRGAHERRRERKVAVNARNRQQVSMVDVEKRQATEVVRGVAGRTASQALRGVGGLDVQQAVVSAKHLAHSETA